MKAIIREFQYLKPKQQERIKEYITEVGTEVGREVAQKERLNDLRVSLELFIKIACCINHDCFGHGETRLNYFLGSLRRSFNRQGKLTSRGEWEAYIDKRMAELFPKNGFPQDFVDSLLADLEFMEESEIKEVK
jgi:hypothetical protein